MNALKRFLVRCTAYLMRRSNAERLEEEMRMHIDMQAAQNERTGMEAAEAHRQAKLKFGAAGMVRESYHATARLPFLDDLVADVRFAVRQLMKAPGFTVAAVLTLTVGIGANTAIFSSMDAVVLRPLAVPRLDRVVTVAERQQARGDDEPVALGDYTDWAQEARSFEELAATRAYDTTLTGDGDPEHLRAALSSATFFKALRAQPLLGRLYAGDECREGHDDVAVLAYGFWRRRFNGDTRVLGRRITLDSRVYTVIGVMPKTMQYPPATDVYLPLAPVPTEAADRKLHEYLVIGRLRDGISVRQAQAELNTLAAHRAQEFPATNAGWTVHVEPLLDGINGPYTPEYYRMCMGATLFLLLVVCANVANLQLARGVARRPEMALRTALGAGRWRILRQALTENILLALLGAAGGLAFSALYLHLTLVAMPPDVARYVPGWSNMSLNGRALLFSLALACGAGAVAGFAPALEALRVNPVDELKAGARAAVGSSRMHRLRSVFAGTQIALAVALVVGAALVAKGMNVWLHIADRYQPERMLTFSVSLPAKQYDTDARRAAWYADSLAVLRRLPGVTHAELASALPYDDQGWVRDVATEGRPAAPGKFQSATYLPVSAGYFDALRIPLIAGRGFDGRDTLGARPVAVVDERFAREYFAGEIALGRRIRIGGSDSPGPWLTIVGVARQTEYSLWDPTPHAAVYVSTMQLPPQGALYAITTNGPPASLAPMARRALTQLDPMLPLNAVQTYAQRMHQNFVGLEYFAAMLGFDAAFALLLASIGIFAVMSNLVGERKREIGVRLAMGARRSDVLSMVLRRAGLLTALGLGSGLALAFLLAHGVASLLRGVSANDPVVFGSIAMIIALVALSSSWLPAWRAGHIDPMVALREE